MGSQYLVVDLGGTFTKYALMTEDAQVIQKGKVVSATASEDETLASLARIREEVDGTSYEGVAFSMPGRIDTAQGIAHTGGAFSWIHAYPAAHHYGAIFGLPATIANDGKCAAYAESWKGALSDVESGAVLVLGTAVGGGIVLNRHVWMGSSGGAGELSGMVVDYDAAREGGIGSVNPTTMWASHVSATAITRQFARRKGLEKADGIMLFDAYEAGDDDATAVLDEFAANMATGIYSLQTVLDLPRYAIGGGISARPETTQLISDAVHAILDPKGDRIAFTNPEIVTCTFGSEANLVGALAFHLDSVGRR